ncbi:MAG: hypothetical protein WBC04_06735 [Candidatus Acidiferrales bacterium]|jgi:hypothetical protein
MSEHARTELVVCDDPRLIGALGCVVEHAGQRAGLSEQAQKQLASAAEEACREIIPRLNGRERCLKCTVEDFADRVEVILEHPGTRATPEAGSRSRLLEQVDHVEYETREGHSRVVLTKNLHPPKK